MQEEMLNEELEEELDGEENNLENDSEKVEETKNVSETPVKVELLEYRSKEDIVQEIESYVIDENLSLKEKINKCRFQEELKPLIKDINFEEKILISSFEGNEEEMMTWIEINNLVNDRLNDKKSGKLLPLKKDFIKSMISEEKRKVDLENKKRKEAAKPKPKQKENKEKTEDKPKKYKYPFKLHFAGRNIETDHIFENDKEYKPEDITKKMLEHQYYEFAGSVSYTYIEKDNVLIPIFQQYKKG